MIFGSTQNKKVPRFLLAQADEYLHSVPGVCALWPDRSESPVYDLSLSGMAIGTNDHSGKVKFGQSIEFRLRIPNLEDHVVLKARLVRTHSKYLGFLFESMSIEGRLILDQHTKDRLIVESIHEENVQNLLPSLRGDLWLHGAFDTNVIVWKNSETQMLDRVLIEYENLVWMYDKGELVLQKSASAVEDTQNYFNPTESFIPAAKVSMGASWLDRLIKVVQRIDEKRGDLFALTQLLRSQREH